MNKKHLIPLAVLVLLSLFSVACKQQKVTVGFVAWKLEANGDITVKTSGTTVNTEEYRISPILELGPDQVAVGKNNEILGPGGSYPDLPNPQDGFRLWTIEPAFYTDGTITGIAGVPHPNSPNEMMYELLDQPGYHPYPNSQVRKFINGPIQIRLQSVEVTDVATGKTGLDICRENPTNDICDGSITGLILNSTDPAVKGSMDLDFIAYWDFSDPAALWAIGDPYEFIVKMTVNKVRSLRSIASGITPLDFVNSNEVEQFLVAEVTEIVNTSLNGYPLKINETRVRGRFHTITPIQAAEADHQAAMQALSNSQAEIAARLEHDQAQLNATRVLKLEEIAINQEIAMTEQAANVDTREWEREQAIADEAAGLSFFNCVQHLYSLQTFDENDRQTGGPQSEELMVLAIGCMPSSNIEAFSQWQPDSILVNPLAPQPTQ